MEWASGDMFEGEWKSGFIQVSCLLFYSHHQPHALPSCAFIPIGIILSILLSPPSIHPNHLQGKGTFQYTDGGKYTGDWSQVLPARVSLSVAISALSTEACTKEWTLVPRSSHGVCRQ